MPTPFQIQPGSPPRLVFPDLDSDLFFTTDRDPTSLYLKINLAGGVYWDAEGIVTYFHAESLNGYTCTPLKTNASVTFYQRR